MNTTIEEIDSADKAREYQELLGWHGVDTLKRMITNNELNNCEITVDDVTRAEQLYGPAVPTLKGKMKRPKTQTHSPIVRMSLDKTL